jgi:hypothetical protein
MGLPMRQRTSDLRSHSPVQAQEIFIRLSGHGEFETALLAAHPHPFAPAALYSMGPRGSACARQLFMSASLGVPDTKAVWT